MKKKIMNIISISMTLVMLSTLCCITLAKHANIKTTKISFNNYSNLSKLERGRKILTDSHYTNNYIDLIPDNIIEKISTAKYGEQASLYFKETGLGKNGKNVLKEIDKKTFDEENQKSIEDMVENYADKISVIDGQGNIIHNGQKRQQKLKGNSYSSDGGLLKLYNTLYKLSDSGPSAYLMAGQFIWTTMPEYRGKDFYGFMRDSNTVEIPNCYHGITQYKEQDYLFLAGTYGVSYTKSGDPITHV